MRFVIIFQRGEADAGELGAEAAIESQAIGESAFAAAYGKGTMCVENSPKLETLKTFPCRPFEISIPKHKNR